MTRKDRLTLQFIDLIEDMEEPLLGYLEKILDDNYETLQMRETIDEEIAKVDKRISITTTENHSIVLNDVVKQPSHYIGDNGLEVEEVLRNFIPRYEDSYVGHRVASAMEYLLRSPMKNGLEDLKKARYNLDQAINHIEGENNEDKPIQGRNE